MTSLCAKPRLALSSVCACFMLFGGLKGRGGLRSGGNTRATLTASEQCDHHLHTMSLTFHMCRVELVFPPPMTAVRIRDKNKPKASSSIWQEKCNMNSERRHEAGVRPWRRGKLDRKLIQSLLHSTEYLLSARHHSQHWEYRQEQVLQCFMVKWRRKCGRFWKHQQHRLNQELLTGTAPGHQEEPPNSQLAAGERIPAPTTWLHSSPPRSFSLVWFKKKMVDMSP